MNQPIEEKWKDTFVEAGANIEHDRWARWQKYMFSKCVPIKDAVLKDGDMVIPAECVDRWFRQIDTPYSDLSEAEKESDRKETRNYLPIIENLLEQERQRMSEEVKELPWLHNDSGVKELEENVDYVEVKEVLSIINK